MAEAVISTLDVTNGEQIIAIRENKFADANFLLTSLIAKCFKASEQICIVILHNTLGHYHNVGRRLGYDLLQQITDNHARTIEPLRTIAENFEDKHYLQSDKEAIVKQLFLDVKQSLDELKQYNRPITLFIDDISHLLDLGIDLKYVIRFAKYCNSFTMADNISVVINCHVATETDEILSNILFHSADLALVVSALKTGRSKSVSGILAVNRQASVINSFTKQNVYHFKLFDSEIKIFHPGQGLI